jgi:hypothetical protein
MDEKGHPIVNDFQRQIANQHRALRMIDLDEYHLTPTGGARVARDKGSTTRIPPSTIHNMLISGWIKVSPTPPGHLVATEAGRAVLKKLDKPG